MYVCLIYLLVFHLLDFLAIFFITCDVFISYFQCSKDVHYYILPVLMSNVYMKVFYVMEKMTVVMVQMKSIVVSAQLSSHSLFPVFQHHLNNDISLTKIVMLCLFVL